MADGKPVPNEAMDFAELAHAGQKYGNTVPYTRHLKKVVETLESFGIHDDVMICAGWLHDCMEDAGVSYNDIKQEFGVEVAELVYCVTNELGRNRKERNAKTYPKLLTNPRAIMLKLADRIANVKYGLENGGKYDMYAKEFDGFAAFLYTAFKSTEHYAPDSEDGKRLEKMWHLLARLLNRTDALV